MYDKSLKKSSQSLDAVYSITTRRDIVKELLLVHEYAIKARDLAEYIENPIPDKHPQYSLIMHILSTEGEANLEDKHVEIQNFENYLEKEGAAIIEKCMMLAATSAPMLVNENLLEDFMEQAFTVLVAKYILNMPDTVYFEFVINDLESIEESHTTDAINNLKSLALDNEDIHESILVFNDLRYMQENISDSYKHKSMYQCDNHIRISKFVKRTLKYLKVKSKHKIKAPANKAVGKFAKKTTPILIEDIFTEKYKTNYKDFIQILRDITPEAITDNMTWIEDKNLARDFYEALLSANVVKKYSRDIIHNVFGSFFPGLGTSFWRKPVGGKETKASSKHKQEIIERINLLKIDLN